MTADKKRSAKKKHATKKSSSHDKKKYNKSACKFIHDQLPKICYIIAVCDLLHALYFTISAMMLLVESVSFFMDKYPKQKTVFHSNQIIV